MNRYRQLTSEDRHLRGSPKQRRKRYGRYDSRGRLAGKRPISERPATAQNRSQVGHLEGDTVIGSSDKHCVLTLVDRKTGYVMISESSKLAPSKPPTVERLA